MNRKPAVHGQHRLAVRQRSKSFRSSPTSDARITTSSEWQVTLEHMPCPIVDRHAAGVDVACQPSYFIGVRTKVIQGKRTRPSSDVANAFVQRVARHNGQDWVE